LSLNIGGADKKAGDNQGHAPSEESFHSSGFFSLL
jgi:hypothetical protein